MRRIDREWPEDRIDRTGVSNLAQAMRYKLKEKRLEGRYGWADQDVCSTGMLRRMLRSHSKKCDMVDIANFAMMIHNREHCMKPRER